MEEKEFNEYLTERIHSNDFKTNLVNFYEDLFNEILDTNLTDLIDPLKDEINDDIWDTRLKRFSQIFTSLSSFYYNLVRDQLLKDNKTISEIMDKETLSSYKKLISEQIDIPDHAIRSILDQPVVKELFTHIVYNAIMAFNKKVNPLSGAFAAFGLDNQIKDFIQGFSDPMVDVAFDFLTDKSNKPMFSEFSGKIFEIGIEEKISKYKDINLNTHNELLNQAIEKTTHDKKLKESSKTFALNIINQFLDTYHDKTLRQFLEEKKVDTSFEKISDLEIETSIKILEAKASTKFLFTELKAFENR